MKPIFIDANSLLRFYDSNKSELTTALNNLIKISKRIFISQQVVYEVRRNNYNLFKKSIDQYTNRPNVPKIIIPAHIISKAEKLKKWTKNDLEILKSLNKSTEEVKQLLHFELENIYNKTDIVSSKLEKIFKNKAIETNDDLTLARLRKERGNPPGKKSDPLGDQLTWTQFLNQIDTSENEIWIITSDTDYIIEVNKKNILNPFLLDELKLKNPDIKVNCFDTIIEALASYHKKFPISKFPTEKTVKEIKVKEDSIKKEQQYLLYQGSEILNSIAKDNIIFTNAVPTSWCPHCKDFTATYANAPNVMNAFALRFEAMCGLQTK